MKIDLHANEVRIKWDGDTEQEQVKRMLDRLDSQFAPVYTTWIFGRKIEGKVIENPTDTTIKQRGPIVA